MGSTECCCRSSGDSEIVIRKIDDSVSQADQVIAELGSRTYCKERQQGKSPNREVSSEEVAPMYEDVEYLLGRTAKWKTPKAGSSPGMLGGVQEEEAERENGDLQLSTAGHLQRWSTLAKCEVTSHVEATSYFNFQISFKADIGRCSVSPEHQVVFFKCCHQYWLRQQSALLRICVVKETDVPTSVHVGGVVSNQQGESATMKGDFLQFELLYDLLDDMLELDRDVLPRAQTDLAMLPLSITSGPSRLNPDTQQLEFIRVDLGRCLRNRSTEQIDNPSDSAMKLFRTRWWVCLELIRFVCQANRIETNSLSKPIGAPLRWVMCLMSGNSSLSPTCSGLSSPEPRSSSSENPPLPALA